MTSIAKIAVLALVACKSSTPPASTGSAGSASAGSGSASDTTQVSSEVRAAMTELGSYTERLYTIMRTAKDCDDAAHQLEALVPQFQELGPRMMKVKERMMALPQADRDRIKQGREKASPAFAAIAPKVMFVKKP